MFQTPTSDYAAIGGAVGEFNSSSSVANRSTHSVTQQGSGGTSPSVNKASLIPTTTSSNSGNKASFTVTGTIPSATGNHPSWPMFAESSPSRTQQGGGGGGGGSVTPDQSDLPFFFRQSGRPNPVAAGRNAASLNYMASTDANAGDASIHFNTFSGSGAASFGGDSSSRMGGVGTTVLHTNVSNGSGPGFSNPNGPFTQSLVSNGSSGDPTPTQSTPSLTSEQLFNQQQQQRNAQQSMQQLQHQQQLQRQQQQPITYQQVPPQMFEMYAHQQQASQQQQQHPHQHQQLHQFIPQPTPQQGGNGGVLGTFPSHQFMAVPPQQHHHHHQQQQGNTAAMFQQHSLANQHPHQLGGGGLPSYTTINSNQHQHHHQHRTPTANHQHQHQQHAPPTAAGYQQQQHPQQQQQGSMAGVCKDHIVGRCTRPNCRFLHLPNSIRPLPEDVCKDYARGSCGRPVCRFFHGSPEELVRLKALQRSNPDLLISSTGDALNAEQLQAVVLNPTAISPSHHSEEARSFALTSATSQFVDHTTTMGTISSDTVEDAHIHAQSAATTMMIASTGSQLSPNLAPTPTAAPPAQPTAPPSAASTAQVSDVVSTPVVTQVLHVDPVSVDLSTIAALREQLVATQRELGECQARVATLSDGLSSALVAMDRIAQQLYQQQQVQQQLPAAAIVGTTGSNVLEEQQPIADIITAMVRGSEEQSNNNVNDRAAAAPLDSSSSALDDSLSASSKL